MACRAWLKASSTATITKSLHLLPSNSQHLSYLWETKANTWWPIQRKSCGSKQAEASPPSPRTRALNHPGDYLPPAQLTKLIALLWPDASQENDSDVACLLNVGQAPHTEVWTAATTTQCLPASLARLFSGETLSHLNVASCLISAILAVLLIATAPEEFGIPECTTTVEQAGLDGPHRWGIILPNSS